MKNKYKLFFVITCIFVLFLLSGKFVLYETWQNMNVSYDLNIEHSVMDAEQEQNSWNMECLCALQKKGLSITAIEKIVRLIAATIVLENLFHMNQVLFLQGKGRVFVCFKSCVFYPAHFLCELFIRQKSDGKKRYFLS